MKKLTAIGLPFLLAMAGLGGLLYGVDFGVIAAAEPYLMALGIYSGREVSLIVGAVLVGGLVSSLTAGLLCDWLGRKKTIVLAAVIDRKGRSWLLKLGTGGMTVGLFAIGAVFLAIEQLGVKPGNATGVVTLVLFFAVNGVLYYTVACFIPETKGKTLDELEHLFDNHAEHADVGFREESVGFASKNTENRSAQ